MNDKKNISINIESSKSLYNRALICGSFTESFQILGSSDAEDVVALKNCLSQLKNRTPGDYFCGSGGTTFRFFLMRASRCPGEYKITGTHRLFERPQKELTVLARQLGFDLEIGDRALLKTSGWKKPEGPLEISQGLSSQFVSAVILNSWDLDFDLNIKTHSGTASDSYLKMTLDFMKDLGFIFERHENEIFIPKGQKLKKFEILIEPDMSSSFFAASLASEKKDITLLDFPRASLQPDFKFVEVLRHMGFTLNFFDGSLQIAAPNVAKPVTLDLEQTPDLFPVLAILCSRAEGVSTLTGLQNLAHKESHRLQRVSELLVKLGVSVSTDGHTMRITGCPQGFPHRETVFLDPDHDHRLVMSGIVARNLGAKIEIADFNPIRKSFPQFFDLQKDLNL